MRILTANGRTWQLWTGSSLKPLHTPQDVTDAKALGAAEKDYGTDAAGFDRAIALLSPA